MKRLRDIQPSTPLQREAQQLLSAVDPLPPAPERMARVRRRLDAPRGVWLALRRLPAVAIAGLIALFGASAFAAVRVFVEVQESSAVEAAQQVERARERKRVQPKRAEPAQAAEPAAVEPEAIDQQPLVPAPELVPEPAVAPRPVRPEAERAVPRARSKGVTRTAEQEREEAVHDSELVHRAVKALRRDRNPALAARLLEEDRVRNPSGPLAEEALSLRIEAAIALRDARARTLAEQYVARYPSGRYLAIARRALGEGTAK